MRGKVNQAFGKQYLTELLQVNVEKHYITHDNPVNSFNCKLKYSSKSERSLHRRFKRKRSWVPSAIFVILLSCVALQIQTSRGIETQSLNSFFDIAINGTKASAQLNLIENQMSEPIRHIFPGCENFVQTTDSWLDFNCQDICKQIVKEFLLPNGASKEARSVSPLCDAQLRGKQLADCVQRVAESQGYHDICTFTSRSKESQKSGMLSNRFIVGRSYLESGAGRCPCPPPTTTTSTKSTTTTTSTTTTITTSTTTTTILTESTLNGKTSKTKATFKTTTGTTSTTSSSATTTSTLLAVLLSLGSLALLGALLGGLLAYRRKKKPPLEHTFFSLDEERETLVQINTPQGDFYAE